MLDLGEIIIIESLNSMMNIVVLNVGLFSWAWQCPGGDATGMKQDVEFWIAADKTCSEVSLQYFELATFLGKALDPALLDSLAWETRKKKEGWREK